MPAVARRRAESGAYRGQRGDTSGVPRADVRVERRRRAERLRAEPLAVDAERIPLARAPQIRGRPYAHARARARTR